MNWQPLITSAREHQAEQLARHLEQLEAIDSKLCEVFIASHAIAEAVSAIRIEADGSVTWSVEGYHDRLGPIARRYTARSMADALEAARVGLEQFARERLNAALATVETIHRVMRHDGVTS